MRVKIIATLSETQKGNKLFLEINQRLRRVRLQQLSIIVFICNMFSSTMSDDIENVLILQGGGSLGAFGCGVYKALAKNNIKIDVIAGTSMGGLNASIIAGSKEDHPEKVLEQYCS